MTTLIRRVVVLGVALLLVCGWALPAPAGLLATPASGGYALTWDGASGAYFNPANPAVVTSPGNLATAVGVTALGSSNYPDPAHTIAHANDGRYGNSHSWLANPGDGAPFIGLNLGGRVLLSGLAFGRDNGNAAEGGTDGTSGQFTDRWADTYTLQYTQVVSPGAGTSETGNPTTGWAHFGTVTKDSAAQPGFVGYLRHQLQTSPLVATGVRIRTGNSGTAIDELELFGPAGYPQAVTQSGAVAYWRLEEPNGATVAYNSGSAGPALNGTYSPAKVDAPGVLPVGGRAADFNPASSAHVAGSGLNATGVFAGDWTIEGWFVRDSVTRAAAIFSNNVGQNSSPLLTFFDANSVAGAEHKLGFMNTGVSWGGAFGIDLAQYGNNPTDYLGKPVYAVLTKTGANDAATASLYVNVDGTWLTPIVNQPVPWTITPGDGFFLGRHYNAGLDFDGRIDDVALYARALSAAEIQSHYMSAVPEPSSLALLFLALAGAAGWRWRRKS